MQLSQCVVVVAVICFLPGGIAALEPNPCLTKACNPGTEVCRELETCDSNQRCFRSAVCISNGESQFLSGGCRVGEPLLVRNSSGDYNLRTCYNDYNCDEEFYCSHELQDMSSRCCRANPVPEVRRGSCPAPKAIDTYMCVDVCRSDADCYGTMKCCQNTRSCPRKVCTTPDPCSLKACNPGTEVCRELETCDSNQRCFRSAVCISNGESQFLSGGCRVGEPLLVRNSSGDYNLRTCYNDYNCDEEFYCSHELQDVPSRCCRANPVPEVRRGSCPAPKAIDRYMCVDVCRSDADCSGTMKCCQNTRSCPRKVCTTPDPCSLKDCPKGTLCVEDSDYNAHCVPFPRPLRVTPRPVFRVSLARCPHIMFPVICNLQCALNNRCGASFHRECGPHKSCCPSFYCGGSICRTPERLH